MHFYHTLLKRPALLPCVGLCWVLVWGLLLAGCASEERVQASGVITNTVKAGLELPTVTSAPFTAIVAPAGSHPFTPVPTPTPNPSPTPTLAPTATPKAKPTIHPSLTVSATVKLGSIVTTTVTPQPQEVTANNIASTLNSQKDTRVTAMPQNLEQAKNKLKALLLDMKATGPNESIEAADLSASGQLDLIAAFVPNWTDSLTPTPGYILVLHPLNGVWTAYVYRKPPDGGAQPDFSHPTLLKVINLNKSRYPQIVFSEVNCTQASCITAVRILSWHDNKWFDLTPVVPAMENVEHIGFENRDNDGSLVLVISGGVVNNPEAGPQRRRSEVYRYDAKTDSFRLSDTTYEASDYLYFRVLDGDDALNHQKYDDAIAYYIDAAYNTKLKSWAKAQNGSLEAVLTEQAALVAFARFRLGIAYLLKGQRQQASDIFNVALNHDGDYKLWTQAFIAPYQDHPTTATVSEGCASAIKLSQQQPQLIAPLNNFGYSNPLFKPEDICPTLKQ